MPANFQPVFAALKPVLARHATQLAVKTDTAHEYTLVGKTPSPFPQHKGHPMWFGYIRVGKAYVSFHLVPIYMDPVLSAAVPAALKKRMQGKACFNFKLVPDQRTVRELEELTAACLRNWQQKNWI